MAVVWFINDTSPATSPYARGYVEGYKDAMKKYNIVTTDSEGNMLSLREIMETVREKLGDLSESEQAAALNAIFEKSIRRM